MRWQSASVVLVALSSLVTPASAQMADVAVLPFSNYTGRHEAFEVVLPILYDQLDELGLTVIRHGALRTLLRGNRIRAVGRLGRRDASILAEATGARLAMLGSIDLYNPDTSMEILVSARVVDLNTMEVLTAISVGRTVQETERWFGTGRAEEIHHVLAPVVDELVAGLRPHLLVPPPPRALYHKCGLVALVPLDDYSERRYGAEVLQNVLMAELVAQDWAIVEPGVVREIMLDEQTVARGGVTNEVLGILRDRIGTCFVVTGELETFSVTASENELAVPELGFGLRLIDARSRRLTSALDVTRNGLDGETWFERGREHSMARMARAAMVDVVHWIEEEGDQ